MRFLKLLERVTDAAAVVGVLIILPLIAAMVFEVFSRYVFNAPTRWAFEVSYMMMAAIFMMGIAYALRTRQHVSVDFIYTVLPVRAKAVINIVGYCLLLTAVAWLTYRLYGYTLQAFKSGQVSGISAWNPQVWPLRAVLTIGFAVFTLQTVIEFVKSVRALFTNDGRDL